MLKPQHADQFASLDTTVKLKLLRGQTQKQIKDLKEEDLGQEMLKMLRDELDTKNITIWEELCSIICCSRSRSYLDFILKNFSKREEEERLKREEEEVLELEKMRNEEKLPSYRESITYSKNKNDKDMISLPGSIDKLNSSKKSIDESLKALEKSGSIE